MNAHISRATGRSTTRWRGHIADRTTVRRKCNRAQGHARRVLIRCQEAAHTVGFRRVVRLRESPRTDRFARHTAICPTHASICQCQRRWAPNMHLRDFPFAVRGMELARSVHPPRRSMNHAIEIEKGYFFFPLFPRICRRRCYSSLRIAEPRVARSVGWSVDRSIDRNHDDVSRIDDELD